VNLPSLRDLPVRRKNENVIDDNEYSTSSGQRQPSRESRVLESINQFCIQSEFLPIIRALSEDVIDLIPVPVIAVQCDTPRYCLAAERGKNPTHRRSDRNHPTIVSAFHLNLHTKQMTQVIRKMNLVEEVSQNQHEQQRIPFRETDHQSRVL
jgi:hypothetical protein